MNRFGLIWRTGPDQGDRPAASSAPGELSQMAAAVVHLDHLNVWVGGLYRLQNRAEMVARLHLPPNTSDAEIIGTGWRQWGEGLANQLRGAFAFVLKDGRTGALHAARDVFGQEPLFLARSGDDWIFSGHPQFVRQRLAQKPEINAVKIADFITDTVAESDKTFFLGIDRLPSASWTTITDDQRITERYWTPASAPPVAPCDHSGEQFRELFDRSIAFQRGAHAPVGAFVSGGMDSSTIIGSLLATGTSPDAIVGLSRTYRDMSDWSDGEFIDLLKADLGLSVQEFPSTQTNPLDQVSHVIEAIDGPVQSYGFAAKIPLYRAARSSGVQVLLDGHGGDEIVSYGYGLLNELAQSGRWLDLWAATRAAHKMHGSSRTQLMFRYLVHLRAWNAVRWRWQAMRKPAQALPEGPSQLSDFLSQIAPGDRDNTADPLLRRDHTERDAHEYAMGHPMHQYSQELLVLVGRSFGVESRMPFYDRDLAEFCLSLPADKKLGDDLTRAVLRRAMAGRLPEKLLRRAGKFNFSHAFAKGMLSDPGQILDLTDPSNNNLNQYVNKDWLLRLRERLNVAPSEVDPYDARSIFRIAQLAIWLKSLEH